MKRAHYAGGVAVLTPFALAIAVPAAAHASTGAAGAPQGKGVSLHPVLRVTPDNGCTGTSGFNIPARGDVRGHGWLTRYNPGSLCIGTVVASAFFHKNICKSVSASTKVFGTVVAVDTGFVCGTTGHWKGSGLGFHSLFQGDAALGVSVCVGSEYDGGHKACVTGL